MNFVVSIWWEEAADKKRKCTALQSDSPGPNPAPTEICDETRAEVKRDKDKNT